jgi:hypothetical protein
MSCSSTKPPLLLERAGVRRIKSSIYIPPHPSLKPSRCSPFGEGASRTCVDTYASLSKACKTDHSSNICLKYR